ncbi:MAG: hypothetical protein AAF492_07240 [Verrucomicrobiota bacterium]
MNTSSRRIGLIYFGTLLIYIVVIVISSRAGFEPDPGDKEFKAEHQDERSKPADVRGSLSEAGDIPVHLLGGQWPWSMCLRQNPAFPPGTASGGKSLGV